MDPATGGPCQGIRNTVPAMKELGHLNEVVCLDPPGADFLGRDPFEVHALGKGYSSLGYHPALLPWLIGNLGRFDAVIVHGLWQWTNVAVWLAVRKLLKRNDLTPPYLIMPHGMLDPWFQRTPGRRIKAARNSLYWHFLQKRVIRDADALLFTSAEEQSSARRTFRDYRPKREIQIGYGVPRSPKFQEAMRATFLAKCHCLHGNQPYLLFLGRVHPKKGVDLLIRAYAEICGAPHQRQGKMSADTIHQIPSLVIAGPIDSDYAHEMISLAESLLPDRVFAPQVSADSYPLLPMNPPTIHFTGMLAGDEKWGALYGCEALILPSHQENFGIALVEALACKKPILTTNKVNIWREIKEDRGGLVSDDSFQGICELLIQWIRIRKNNPPPLDPIACHERNFGLEKHVANLVDVLTSMKRMDPMTASPRSQE